MTTISIVAANAQDIFVRYGDPVSGAAVLARAGTASVDAAALIEQAKAGIKPASALRVWRSGGGEEPINYGVPVTCSYVDPRWGVRLTTDCTPPIDDVARWLRPSEAPATAEGLLALMRDVEGRKVLGFGPHRDRASSLIVWAARGSMRDGEPPRTMTLSGSDMRTGAVVVVDASKVKEGDMERHLAAVAGATSLDALVDLVRNEKDSSLLELQTFAEAGGMRLRVHVRKQK